MAIDLLNSFLQKGQNVSTNSKSASTGTTQNLPQNLQVMRAIRSLQAGQTLRGEIISVKGEDVQLAILNDVIIDAKLAQSMNLSPGVSMPFQVKANNQNGLSLIPLFTNTAADPNVLKALDMAQLPVNDRSLEMVQTLMEKGMPIDKQSLQEAYRDVSNYKDFGVRDIISLRHLQLPVSSQNLNQLSAYENNQHYLADTFSEIGNTISQHIGDLLKEGNTVEVKAFLQQLQQLFQSQEGSGNLNSKTVTVLQEDSAMVLSKEALNIEGETVQNAESNRIVNSQGFIPEVKAQTLVPLDGEQKLGHNITPEAAIDGKEVVALKEDSDSVKTWELTKDAKVPGWDDLLREVTSGKDAFKVTKLFERIWGKEVSNQWLMEPEALLDKKQVKDYYEKLDAGIKQLEKIVEQSLDLKSPVAKAVHNTASNLDFMNQMNQMYAYVQLPLKMSGKQAHGELYVFSNKKNLTKQDGKVTALLHLDMEHLGKMDIYVALEDKKVSTNFYMEKEEYLDFLEANMELLNSRLQNRGYECSIKTSLRGEADESVMKSIEKQQGQSMMLSTQAFDVRA